MSNLRRLSKERMRNFQLASGKTIRLKRLQHMMTGAGLLDVSRAKNWLEACAAERITVDPMCQSSGENSQLLKLSNVFAHVERHRSNKVFLHDGKRLEVGEIDNIRTDIDAEIQEAKATVLLTLKTTQTNSYRGGGSQNNSFDHVFDMIQQAPNKRRKGDVWLGVYVSGGFWFEPRNEYRTYAAIYPTTLFDILETSARHKKCIVFTDEDLPRRKTTFHKWFIEERTL